MRRAPRVLMLAPHFDRVGGYERQALSLSCALVRRGVSAWLVSDNYWQLPPREERQGVLIYRLSPPHSPWWREPRWPWTPAERARDLAVFLRLHRDRYDAVHAHAFCPPCDVAMEVARRLGKPAFVKVATEGDPTEIATGDATMRRIWRGLLQARGLLCISHAIADEFLRLGVPASQLVQIPNGVDTGRYRPPTTTERRAARRALALPDGRVALLYVGRLAQRKGIDVLLRAWSGVSARRTGAAVLLVLGEGEEGPSLRTLAAELGLAESVRFLGEHQDVLPVLHAADAFVFPSRREGLSNALLEAMAVRLPVVTTRIGGTVDVITDGDDGLLCDADDAEGLAAHMERLVDDADLRDTLAGRGLERILTTYALDRVVERLLPLYGIDAPTPKPTGRIARAA